LIQIYLIVLDWLQLDWNGLDLKLYCIWGISETTGASSDVYCQSNNENHIRTSCTFYVESIQVKHCGESGREHRERKNGLGFISGTIIWFWLMVLNQHKVFLDIVTGHINTEIFCDNINSKISIRVILGKMFTSNGFSGATTLSRITLRLTITVLSMNISLIEYTGVVFSQLFVIILT
jgi:hypothetical protein